MRTARPSDRVLDKRRLCRSSSGGPVSCGGVRRPRPVPKSRAKLGTYKTRIANDTTSVDVSLYSYCALSRASRIAVAYTSIDRTVGTNNFIGRLFAAVCERFSTIPITFQPYIYHTIRSVRTYTSHGHGKSYGGIRLCACVYNKYNKRVFFTSLLIRALTVTGYLISIFKCFFSAAVS